MLSEEQVKHIAKLARIKLSDEEVEKYAKQLTGVLDYMNILKEVDTDGIKETSQVTGLFNVMEADDIKDYGVSGEELLECSELPIDTNQIRVKKVQ